MAFFPMFIDLKEEPCLVVGGGRVAARKIEVLKEFKADIEVIAPSIIDRIKNQEGITYRETLFQEEDIIGKRLVIAATDYSKENHRIAELCRQHKIMVNAVDQMEDCDFIFSSYIRQKDVVAAVSSGGKSPLITQYIRDNIKDILTEEIGNMAEFLGSQRERVKEEVATEAMRKEVYHRLLDIGLENHRLPRDEEVEAIMTEYIGKEGKE